MRLNKPSNIDDFSGLLLPVFKQNKFSIIFSIKVKTFEIGVDTKKRKNGEKEGTERFRSSN